MSKIHTTPLAVLGILALAVTPVAASAAPSRPAVNADRVGWKERPTALTGNDVNVAAGADAVRIHAQGGQQVKVGNRGFGSVTFEPRTLSTAVDRIRAELSGYVPAGTEAKVEVRGQTESGWGQWTSATATSATLPQRTDRVQARLLLVANDNGTSPRVTGVRMTGEHVPGTQRAQKAWRDKRAAAPLTYEVFATREGLVGETTANGHVIQPRDHFVALPSTRSLSPEGTDDYAVEVCSPDTGRCEIAPVWDVGPWNIGDDYWSPSSVRENWTDLPQGTPEAEAAYTNGYNNGLDGMGREVLNPAGIDLADGTFWDGLGLTDNAWVEVTYLWTSSAPASVRTEASQAPVTIRSAPSTDAKDVGLVAPSVTVPVQCQTRGAAVQNPSAGSTSRWHKLGPEQYIAAAHTKDTTTASTPTC